MFSHPKTCLCLLVLMPSQVLADLFEYKKKTNIVRYMPQSNIYIFEDYIVVSSLKNLRFTIIQSVNETDRKIRLCF